MTKLGSFQIRVAIVVVKIGGGCRFPRLVTDCTDSVVVCQYAKLF